MTQTIQYLEKQFGMHTCPEALSRFYGWWHVSNPLDQLNQIILAFKASPIGHAEQIVLVLVVATFVVIEFLPPHRPNHAHTARSPPAKPARPYSAALTRYNTLNTIFFRGGGGGIVIPNPPSIANRNSS